MGMEDYVYDDIGSATLYLLVGEQSHLTNMQLETMVDVHLMRYINHQFSMLENPRFPFGHILATIYAKHRLVELTVVGGGLRSFGLSAAFPPSSNLRIMSNTTFKVMIFFHW
uniref:Uncharacterized protein n=1 Tax=Glossina austeni TaxID=7395 RepID=A0A1A9V3K3_GLOAU